MAGSGDLVTRYYADFRGVDFGNDPGIVNLSRSPDALNVWRDYTETNGNCIQTRPGYKILGQIGNKINGMFVIGNGKALVHSGTNLFLWSNFPETPELILLNRDMNDRRSVMYKLNDGVYVNDGKNYLVYEEGTLKNVKDVSYIPITTVSRSPSGGGKTRDDVNLLNDCRINSFLGDGESKTYYLDATNITTIIDVKIDGVSLVYETDYVFNTGLGCVTFTTAPSKPTVLGQDNVEITFSKIVSSYAERICGCTIAVPFDNRVFFAGNPDYPNAIFHSSVDNPAYCSDLDYYEDGTTAMVKSLVVGNNLLWVLKESNQNRDTVFYHRPTTDSSYGRVYPRSQGNVAKGCYSSGFNFQDTVVFLSRDGLEGISTNSIESLQLLTHKSSNIDCKMINTSNYANACMCEWLGYLVISVDCYLFLADSRQMFQNDKGLEYEWYYWKINENISFLHNYEDKLYFGTDGGAVFVFEGSNDNGVAIESYWTTPYDQMMYPQFRKTTNKRGSIAKVKNLQNGRISIWVKTDRKDWKLLKEVPSTGFDFGNIDFNNFSFVTEDNFYVVFRVKQKKIKHVCFRFYCNTLNKGFGIYSLNTSAYLGSFVK